MNDDYKNSEVPVPLGSSLCILDVSTAVITMTVGDKKVTIEKSQVPVIYDPKAGDGTNFRKASIREAMTKNIVAPNGYYIVLLNPSENDEFPPEKDSVQCRSADMKLMVGKKIVIRGPFDKPLWPGQSATRIRGHKQRTDNYLVIEVYDRDQALKALKYEDENIQYFIKKVIQRDIPDEEFKLENHIENGVKFNVTGSDFPFFIPYDGFQVLINPEYKNNDNDGIDKYIRNAVSLEAIQCVMLRDESGKTRIIKGNANGVIVVPEPTEEFETDKNGNIIHKALELPPVAGIHVKVNESYTDENGIEYKMGDERFITDQRIYFPNINESIIRYGENSEPIHFGTVIQPGHERYVMDRITGHIRNESKPLTLLNPIEEVFVRRALPIKTAKLLYPGNDEVIEYNRKLWKSSKDQHTGMVSEDSFTEVLKNYKLGTEDQYLSADSVRTRGVSKGGISDEHLGRTIRRKVKYTKPREISLDDTKFSGAPHIRVFENYAMCIASESGDRHVVVGNKPYNLKFDELPEILTFSTGKCKTEHNIVNDVYLQIKNNFISDIFECITSDGQIVNIRLRYHVNFTGDDPIKWFSIPNYPLFLCEQMRSLIKNKVLETSSEDMYYNYTTILNDLIITDARNKFDDNNMEIKAIQINKVRFEDSSFIGQLDDLNTDIISNEFEIKLITEKNDKLTQLEQLKNQQSELTKNISDIETDQQLVISENRLKLNMHNIQSQQTEQKAHEDFRIELEKVKDVIFQHELSRTKENNAEAISNEAIRQELREKLINIATAAAVKQVGALSPELMGVIQAISNRHVATDMAKHVSLRGILGGDSIVDVVRKALSNIDIDAAKDILGDVFVSTNKPDGIYEEDLKS